MIFLLLSCFALFVGPACMMAAGQRRQWLWAVDGFVLVSVGGIVLLHILPHSAEIAGLGWVVGAAALGFILPALIERIMHRVETHERASILLLIFVGLAVHAALDGAALVGADPHMQAGHHTHVEHPPNLLLGLGVILHRLPIGLVLWWIFEPRWGRVRTAGFLAGLAAATITGYYAGEAGLAGLPIEFLSVFQAFVGGSLLHVAIDHPRHIEPSTGPLRQFPAALGALLGLGLLWFLGTSDTHAHGALGGVSISDAFLTLALESAPALLFGFAAAGLIHGFFGTRGARWLSRGGPVGQAGRGMLFGLPLPVCSCGVTPLYKGLVEKGAPPRAAIAFLIATPELGIDAVLISIPLLGGELTVIRVVAAVITAFAVALMVGRRAARKVPETPDKKQTESVRVRLVKGLKYGFSDMVDHIMPWVLVGLAIAAAFVPLLSAGLLDGFPAWLDVPLFALVGIPAYVCASAATPVVAVLIAGGVSPGAAIAFLLTGPATNIVTFGILRDLHDARFAFAFGAAVAGVAIALGYAVNALLVGSPIAVPPLAEHAPSLVEWVALSGLLALILVSWVRSGPRQFVGQVLNGLGGNHDHGDGHGHGHSHAHKGDHDHAH
ncbi:MAG: uncharacterized membrane protein YraQ (UPF0718 family) [Myxococcota bacterium]